MPFGLPERTIIEIKSCFAWHPDIRWVKVYGSRAMGTHRPGSDIDLAFSAPEDYSLRLTSNLSELPTPYLFDVTHYESLTNENLIAHIDEVGQILFTQEDLKNTPRFEAVDWLDA